MGEEGIRPEQWAALVLLTLAGAALRLSGAGDAPLWTDEALTLVIVRSDYADLFFGGIDPTGGLYYSIHKLIVPEGAGLVGVRAVSIACGVLLIPVLFAAARSAAGVRAGLAAAALAAVFPPLVDYSQEARAYSLLLLTIGVSASALIAWSRRGKLRHLALYAGAAILSFYCHPSAIAWIGPSALWLAYIATRRGSQRAVFTALALMAIGSIPEVVRILRYAEGGGMFAWLAQESPAGAAHLFAKVVLPLGWERLAPGVGWVASAAILVWAAWRLARFRGALRRCAGDAGSMIAVAAILLAVPASLWLLGIIATPVLMYRTALPAAVGAVPVLAVLATVGQPLRTSLAQVTALVLLYAGSLLAGGSSRPAEPWERVSALLAAQTRDGDAILVCPSWKGPPLLAALGRLETPLPAPVLLAHRGKVHQLTGEGGWSDAYRQQIFAVDWPRVVRSDQPPRQAKREIRRLWLLDSECVAEERAAIASWAGEGRWRRVAVLPASERRADIAIDLFTPPAPIEKELWVPAMRPPSRTAR